MDSEYAKGLLIFLLAALSILATANAHKNIHVKPKNRVYGCDYTNCYNKYHNVTGVSKRIIVGGAANWQFGVNYTDWALKTAPFYLYDTLVFKYDPPMDNSSHPHSVYLVPDYWSYVRCDLTRARLVANWTQGTGEGFEFTLRTWRPHFFVCGEANGIHCDRGLMKFLVMPIFRRWHN